MISRIVAFELRSRFSQWTTAIFVLMLLFQGIWYTKGTFDYYTNDGVLMNAPAIFYKNFAGGGMLMIIMVAILTGTVLFKDIERQTGQWAYALPVREKTFFLGRFLAAYAINVLLALGYFGGMLLVPYSGIGAAPRFGPAPLGQMLHGFVLFTLPNLFLMTAVIFAALVYFRKMAAGYLALFLTVIFFLVMQSTAETSGSTPVLEVLDCFGYVAVSATIDHLTTFDKNHAYLPVGGTLLLNRVLWLGVALGLLGLAYRRFSFKGFLTQNKPGTAVERGEPEPVQFGLKLPRTSLSFQGIDFLKKLGSLAVLEFKNVVRPSGFRVILGVILLMVLMQNLLWNATYYIGPTVPVTANMTNFRLTFGVFIMLLLMIWAGELFFKDKIVGIWPITDALPVPVWVTQVSKFIAMVGVALVLALAFLTMGVVVQLLHGGWNLIDWRLYAYDILGFNWGWLTYVLEIAFVFFVAGLTGQRYLTHILSVGRFLFMIISFDMGLAEQTIFAYAAVPGLEDYSEISGYGIWTVAARWYFAMWAVLATGFVLLGVLFWERGATQKWFRKLTFMGSQLGWAGKLTALGALVGFFVLQSFIVRNVNGAGNFKFEEQKDQEAAEYERKYGYLAARPQPRYQAVNLTFDFFPAERRAVYQADLTLSNPTTVAIDTLFLTLNEFVRVRELSANGVALARLLDDPAHELSAYRLPQPLAPGASVTLRLRAEKAYRGFTQSGDDPQADLTFDGSFGSIREFLPVIGYDEERELDENRKRTEQGLPKLTSRMAPPTDARALSQDAYAPDALPVTGRLTLGTEAPQTAFGPGQLTRRWTVGNRTYFQYEITQPAPFDWQVGSARLSERVTTANGVKFSVLASPKHPFNVGVYEAILPKAVAFVSKTLGAYPYREARLVEVPRYQGKFFAFPNTIAIAEQEGWLADTSGLKEKAYLYQTVATQLIKHWVQQRVRVAHVQGADLLRVALPEALALHFVREQLGPEAVAVLVKKKQDAYGKDRNNEPNREPALLQADGAEYFEANKGAIALYDAIQALGLSAFSRLLIDWVNRDPDGLRTFGSLYEQFRAKLPPAGREKFET
jgi:ABC-type transport system involved in multi-copper enzyme maturation permease subunit